MASEYYQIVIPGTEWPELRPMNENDRDHWAVTDRRKKGWHQTARLKAVQDARARAIPRPLPPPVQVDVWWRFPTNQRRDVGNLMPTVKALVDGLRTARILVEDHDGVLTGPYLHRDPVNGPPRIIIRLTPGGLPLRTEVTT